MGLNWPKSGPNHVPSFEISGLPYVTRSVSNEVTATPIKVSFPFVTRFFTINNIGAGELRVGFTENGVNSNPDANYFILGANMTGSIRQEIRCKDLFFRRHGNTSTGFEIIAGLTTIPHGQLPILTGSQDPVKPQGIVWTGIG
jgi:hypothetical protein